jgi:hypothetical protein
MLRIVVTTLLLVPFAASAQTYSRTETSIGGYSHQALETSYANLGSRPPSSSDGDASSGKQCLLRKKTGKTECHTYAEWVEIARAIEAGRN